MSEYDSFDLIPILEGGEPDDVFEVLRRRTKLKIGNDLSAWHQWYVKTRGY